MPRASQASKWPDWCEICIIRARYSAARCADRHRGRSSSGALRARWPSNRFRPCPLEASHVGNDSRSPRPAIAPGRAARAPARGRANPRPGRMPAACAAPTCTWSTASCPSPKLPLVPGPRDRRHRRALGAGVEPLRGRRARRRALARLHLRHVRATAAAGRENLCDDAALHRLHARRRLRRVHGGRRALLPSACRTPTRDVEAAPLLCAGLIGYRALRMAGHGAAARPLRLRRRRAHRRPGRPPPGPARSSPSPAPATPRRRLRARPGRGLGRRLRRAAAGAARRRHPFAPVGALVPAALRGDGQGRHGRLRRHPHERHPGFPYRSAVGRARACARSPT